jgi:hypothetical protein
MAINLVDIISGILKYIHTGLEWIRTTLNNVLPQGTMLGFINWATIVLLAVSLIIATLIVKSKYTSISSMLSTGKTRLLIWTAVFFVILRFL